MRHQEEARWPTRFIADGGTSEVWGPKTQKERCLSPLRLGLLCSLVGVALGLVVLPSSAEKRTEEPKGCVRAIVSQLRPRAGVTHHQPVSDSARKKTHLLSDGNIIAVGAERIALGSPVPVEFHCCRSRLITMARLSVSPQFFVHGRRVAKRHCHVPKRMGIT